MRYKFYSFILFGLKNQFASSRCFRYRKFGYKVSKSIRNFLLPQNLFDIYVKFLDFYNNKIAALIVIYNVKRKNCCNFKMRIKHFSYLMLMLFALLSCAESLEERAFREAQEFTEKNCPAPITRELAIDSMTFNKDSHTFTYYYSISPKCNIDGLDVANTETMLLRELRIQTNLMRYKQAGYSFRYIYYSLKEPEKHLIDVTYHQKDYAQ